MFKGLSNRAAVAEDFLTACESNRARNRLRQQLPSEEKFHRQMVKNSIMLESREEGKI